VRLSNLAKYPSIRGVHSRSSPVHGPAPEKGLIPGWNSGAAHYQELEEYVVPGSELLIVSKVDLNEEKIKPDWPGSGNNAWIFQAADAADRQVPRIVRTFPVFQHVIVFHL